MEESALAPASTLSKNMRWLWIAALLGSFLLCVRAAFRGGYVGPDYFTHLMRINDWTAIFDFSTTSPPGYYLLGHWILNVIGRKTAFLHTVAITQAAINTIALAAFILYTERRFISPFVHTSWAIFLAFLPVRMIHSTVFGTDCTTIPAFVLILICLDRLLAEGGLTWLNAIYLGVSLTIAVCLKYTFMALLPMVFLIFVVLWLKRSWGFKRFVIISLISLTAASAFSAYSLWQSRRTHGYNTDRHWLKRGSTYGQDMDFKDIFSIKRADATLFKAPQAFKTNISEPHLHSYLGLSHYGIFTDPMNLFQELRMGQGFYVVLIPDQHERLAWKTTVMVSSMLLGVIWTVCAIIGTAWALYRAGRNLWKGKLEREDNAILLGIAFFLLIYLAIPFVFLAGLFGYWTPRLILPSVLCFALAGFLFIDHKLVREAKDFAFVVMFLVAIQSTLEIVMLS